MARLDHLLPGLRASAEGVAGSEWLVISVTIGFGRIEAPEHIGWWQQSPEPLCVLESADKAEHELSLGVPLVNRPSPQLLQAIAAQVQGEAEELIRQLDAEHTR